jgi:hypothetical protein
LGFWRCVALLACAGSSSGCGYGLMQTAHTEAPGHVATTLGESYVGNALSDSGGRNLTTNIGTELAARVGLNRHVDLGVGPWLGEGARADFKLDVLAPENPWALAPRIGAGIAVSDSSATTGDDDDGNPTAIETALVGVIGSYRAGTVEPYVGVTFANHWIYLEHEYPDELPPGQRYTPRTGAGDGLFQIALGAEIAVGVTTRLLLEYQRWQPAQDDPGDAYAFVPSNVLSVALRFGVRGSH